MTKNGEEPLPSEKEHCSVVEVTEEEVKNSVRLIPSWTTVVRGWGRKALSPGAVAAPLRRTLCRGLRAAWSTSPIAGPLRPLLPWRPEGNEVTLSASQ